MIYGYEHRKRYLHNDDRNQRNSTNTKIYQKEQRKNFWKRYTSYGTGRRFIRATLWGWSIRTSSGKYRSKHGGIYKAGKYRYTAKYPGFRVFLVTHTMAIPILILARWIVFNGLEQWSACQSHKLEVEGSSPSSVTIYFLSFIIMNPNEVQPAPETTTPEPTGVPVENQGMASEPVSPMNDPIQLAEEMRTFLKQAEEMARTYAEIVKGPFCVPMYDKGEVIADAMLALRHIEDARMRYGKCIQYADTTKNGESVYPR